MNIPEKDRIELLISLLEDGNGAAFARKIGCDKARITDIRKGVRGIDRYRGRILAAYPDFVTSAFLDTGDIGAFPVFALLSYFMRENERLVAALNEKKDE